MHYFSSYLTLLRRLLFILIIYTLSRFGYFLFNLQWYAGMSIHDILYAFTKGILFDLKTILYINLVFILLSLLPFNFIFKKWYQNALKIFFFITNLIPLCFNIADYQYSKFIGKRSDINLFGVREDIRQQFGQMALDFWYLAIIAILFGYLLWRFYPRKITQKYKIKTMYILPVFVLFSSLLFLGLRGSLKVKPLLPVAAYNGSPERANLMLNTPFCIIHTIGKQPLEILNYYTDEELNSYLKNPYTLSDTGHLGSNIMIIIVESLSREFVGHLNGTEGFTPFLDSLASYGITFRYCLANGRTSQQAVPSILAGIPQFMDESIATSIYQTDNFFSIPVHLKKFGYSAYFFHGGHNGTMGFDKFTGKMGYQYFGLDEYPNMEDFDGSWGIFDGPYLKYVADTLNKLPKPFVASVFTLSSHQPYSIPKNLKHLFTRGDHPEQNAIAYTDYSLRGFFNEAKKYDWYKHTLFIITADHTFPAVGVKYKGFIDEYRIPLIMYHPGIKLTADSMNIVEQIDIMPSVGDFLGINPEIMPKFGNSVFAGDVNRHGIIYNHSAYYLVKKGYYIEMLMGNFRYRDWYDKPVELPDSLVRDTSLLKAYRQYFNNSLVNNSFIR